jgi:hypothetical protein
MEGLSQDFVQEVCEILSKSLSNNNEERNLNEARYHKLLAERPEQLLLSLILALKAERLEVRTLSAILLKNLLKPSAKYFAGLSEVYRQGVKTELLNALNAQSDRKVKELLAEDIGLLGVTILTAGGSNGQWNELLPYVYQIITNGGELRLAGLYVLKAMFPYMFEEMTQNPADLMQLFRVSLTDPSYFTRLACLSSMTSLISVAETQKIIIFSELVPEMLRSVDFIMTNHQCLGSSALETITELVQSEPKIFKQSFANCIELAAHFCAKSDLDPGVRSLVLEFAVSLSERMPRQIQKEIKLGTTLMQLIFAMMVQIDLDVEDFWKTPEEGFSEKEEEEGGINIDYAKVGRKLISRLIDSVGDTFLLTPCLQSIHAAVFSQDDWRLVYAGLMTLSEVLQYITDDAKLSEILPLLQPHLQSSHCKIRYASFHVLGQICEDHGPDFQKTHHETIVPRLLAGLQDPIPRVSAHSCAAITNFMEHLGNPLGGRYAEVFMPMLVTNLSSPVSLVVENTVTCIASIASSISEAFTPYYLPLLQALLPLFDKYNKDVFKMLLGKLIECVTLMSKAVGKQVFHPYADKIVSLMKYLQQSGTSQEELTGYVLNGWQRICELLREDFAIYLDAVVPEILKLLAMNVEISTSAPVHFVDLALASENKNKNVSTTETENKELGLQALATFVEELKTGYVKHVDSTVLVTLPLLDFTLNESVRSSAAVLLSSLISVVRPVELPKAINMAKVFLAAIWKAVDDEYTNETLVDELQSIKDIIDSMKTPFLSLEEVKTIGEKSLKILENSLENRIKTKEDSDDELDEGFQEFTKREEDNLHVSISEVFGALFRTHKSSCLDIVHFLYTSVFSKLLAENTRKEDHKFVIFVIDDILEFIGQDLVGDKWPSFGEVLTRFATDPHDAVRQAAVYGLGVFAENTKTGFENWSAVILQKLHEAIQYPKGKSEKTHGHARDNAIAAIGKVIQFHAGLIDVNLVVSAWLGLLPLRFDKMESKNMTELVTNLALNQPQVLFGENYERLERVVRLLLEVVDSKYVKDDSRPKIVEVFARLRAAGVPQLQGVWDGLTADERNVISRLLGN